MTVSVWFSILSAVLSIAKALVGMMEQRKWMEAGAAQATLKGLREADDAIAKAQAVRQAVRDKLAADPSKLRDDDGFRRD